MRGHNLWAHPVPPSAPASLQDHSRPPPSARSGRSADCQSLFLRAIVISMVAWHSNAYWRFSSLTEMPLDYTDGSTGAADFCSKVSPFSDASASTLVKH